MVINNHGLISEKAKKYSFCSIATPHKNTFLGKLFEIIKGIMKSCLVGFWYWQAGALIFPAPLFQNWKYSINLNPTSIIAYIQAGFLKISMYIHQYCKIFPLKWDCNHLKIFKWCQIWNKYWQKLLLYCILLCVYNCKNRIKISS